MKKISYLFFGTFTFLLFVLFSYFVHKDLFTQFDFDMTVKLQDNLSRRVDVYFSFLSELGNFEFLTIALVAVLLLFRKFIGVFGVLFSFALFHLVEIYGKTFVNHPPPPEFMLRIEKIMEFPQFHVRNEFSYPSGHAARTAFISVIIFALIRKNRRLKPMHKYIVYAIILSFDILMFVSRPYLGEHWTTDVIGGVLLGAAFAIASLIFI